MFTDPDDVPPHLPQGDLATKRAEGNVWQWIAQGSSLLSLPSFYSAVCAALCVPARQRRRRLNKKALAGEAAAAASVGASPVRGREGKREGEVEVRARVMKLRLRRRRR